MSKNWGRTPVTNADKRHLTQMTYMVATGDVVLGDEERVDRRPMGKVERWVDPNGNVVSLQMYTDGDDKKLDTEQRLRAQNLRKGFVTHAKCPLKHGGRNASEQARKDFSKMPDEWNGHNLVGECKHDPRVMELVGGDKRAGIRGDLYAREACPHIEWLIVYRTSEARKAFLKRNAHLKKIEEAEAAAKELQAQQTELVREQLAERKARKPKAKEATE